MAGSSILEQLCEAYRLFSLKRLDEAEPLYRQVLSVDPENRDANRFLGALLGAKGRYPESLPFLEQAVKHPDNAELSSVWFDLGVSQIHNANPDSVLRGMISTNIGLGADPQAWPAYWNLALGHLLLGEWEPGWRFYEMGYMSGSRSVRTRDADTVWKGEELGPDKTIFVHWEQGLGDTLMFLRFLPMLKERSGGARIVLEVQRPLWPLLKYCSGAIEAADEVIKFNPDKPEKLPKFDAWISLMSLPFRLGIKSPEDVPSAPYLHPFGENWFDAHHYDRSEFRVGLVWAGNPDHSNDTNRSLHLADLAALGTVKGAQFYALQVGSRMDEAETPPDTFVNFTNLGPDCERLGFRHAANLLKGLDVLVTCDTAIAHLAGAMGIQTYIVLPWAPDYRWGLDSCFTPLYPNMQLFRQPKPGDWRTVARKVAARLHTDAGFKIGED